MKPAEEVPKWSKRWGDGFGSSEGGRDLFYSAIKHDSPLLRAGVLSPKKERTVFNALLKRVSIFTLAVDRGTI